MFFVKTFLQGKKLLDRSFLTSLLDLPCRRSCFKLVDASPHVLLQPLICDELGVGILVGDLIILLACIIARVEPLEVLVLHHREVKVLILSWLQSHELFGLDRERIHFPQRRRLVWPNEYLLHAFRHIDHFLPVIWKDWLITKKLTWIHLVLILVLTLRLVIRHTLRVAGGPRCFYVVEHLPIGALFTFQLILRNSELLWWLTLVIHGAFCQSMVHISEILTWNLASLVLI